MNQLCRVCGEPAAGFHFGAFTCEGCKSFFGRTYNNLGSISECKNNGECVINKKNRTSCKACRLRKCLTVGMSKSGSRYGRRSNWFKIHCLLQEQGQPGLGGKPWGGEEDNNNSLKEVVNSGGGVPGGLGAGPGGGMWRLPLPLGGLPLFGFPPPLPPLFLARPPPPSPTAAPIQPPPPPAASAPPPIPSPSNSLDLLRGLGPVQDSPMDLSRRNHNTSYSANSTSDDPSSPPPSSPETPKEQQCPKKTPLDLTCVKT